MWWSYAPVIKDSKISRQFTWRDFWSSGVKVFNVRFDPRTIWCQARRSSSIDPTRPVIIASLFLILTSVVLFLHIKTTPFLPDESGWISAGIYYSKLLLKLDFTPDDWECSACDGFGSLNPHVGKWMIGLPLILMPDSVLSPSEREFFAFVEYTKSPEENVRTGNVPGRNLLLKARLAPAVVGVGCVILVLAITLRVAASISAGAIVVSLLLINTLFVECATRAMTDIQYNFFLLALAAYLIRTVRKPKSLLVSSTVCGALAGLAFSVKVTGIVLGCCIFLTVIVYSRVTQSITRGLSPAIIMFTVSFLCIIYGLNPNFWPTTRGIDPRLITSETQSILMDNTRPNIHSEEFGSRYPQLSSLSRLLEFPRLFLRWKNQMKGQKIKFSGEFKGNRLLLIQKRLFWDYSSFPLEFVFFAVGITVCGIRLRRSFMTRKTDPAVIPFCYFFINYIFMLLFLDVDWDRYFLPTVIANKIIVAIGISSLIHLSVSSVFSNSHHYPDAVQECVDGA